MTSVLIVDDHAIVREGYVRLITSDPRLTVCGEAESVEEGYSIFLSKTPDVGDHGSLHERLVRHDAAAKNTESRKKC